jgi:hypothetical protein
MTSLLDYFDLAPIRHHPCAWRRPVAHIGYPHSPPSITSSPRVRSPVHLAPSGAAVHARLSRVISFANLFILYSIPRDILIAGRHKFPFFEQ